MINAFSFQVENDTTGAAYFFLAFFHQSGNQAYDNIREYIKYAPTDIRGHLFYSNLYFNENQCRGECVILIGKSKENVYFN